FLFGSEVKAMLAHPAMRAELDPEALLEYMTFQNFFADRTLFQGVKLLPAGSWLTLKARIKKVAVQRFWDYAFTEPSEAEPLDQYAEELNRLFLQAVSRQLVSDVPVSAYLSGGMDSGSVTAIAARQISNLRTF